MSSSRLERVALVGNPNSGKSSLFNFLTGLNQKVANYPGVTVDRKSGFCTLPGGRRIEVIDLPGVYSIYVRTQDEAIVLDALLNPDSKDRPDKLLIIADVTNLKRSLLLVTQCIDLGFPTLLALNMNDLAKKAGIEYDSNILSDALSVSVVSIDARRGKGIQELKELLASDLSARHDPVYRDWEEVRPAVESVRHLVGIPEYGAYQILQQPVTRNFLSVEHNRAIDELRRLYNIRPGMFQGAETIQRYAHIQTILERAALPAERANGKSVTKILDRILIHPVWGYAIFFAILVLIFQAVYSWAEAPMNLIDKLFGGLSKMVSEGLPAGPLNDLLAEGIIPGLGGILIFIPQIAILFAFISILEESGYMARVVFIMDKLMRKVGLSGRSVVPLMSGLACAIPAIMATRTIEGWKERMITIFVTPLISCSARLPVFAILIALVIPDRIVAGVFNLQGLTLMGMYLLGFVAAISSAWIMKMVIKAREKSYLIMELPIYRWPKWSNVGYTLVEKTKTFVLEAGKIILAISIVLWALSSYGPAERMNQATEAAREAAARSGMKDEETENLIATRRLESSFAGSIGRFIEPVVKPLGYDWKIGIALVTSFAAREVFVGTMATLYSVGSADDTASIQERMEREINPETGEKRFTLALGLSLLVFYTFAMQCMSTLAVVYRETRSWKWPFMQAGYMTMLAYVSAFVVYHLFS